MTMPSPFTFLPLLLLLLLLPFAPKTLGGDPDPLQDICVADLSSGLSVNGFPCKAAANVTEADFFFQGLAKPSSTNNTMSYNTMGFRVAVADVLKIPGLNTLGVSLARADCAPGGIIPPHTHPFATEIIFVLEGTLDVGFITTANKLVSKTITKGDIFVFPRGLVHFQKNSGDTPAALLAAFNSQLLGVQTIAATLFASTPPVGDDVLGKAFQIGVGDVQKIKKRLTPKR